MSLGTKSLRRCRLAGLANYGFPSDRLRLRRLTQGRPRFTHRHRELGVVRKLLKKGGQGAERSAQRITTPEAPRRGENRPKAIRIHQPPTRGFSVRCPTLRLRRPATWLRFSRAQESPYGGQGRTDSRSESGRTKCARRVSAGGANQSNHRHADFQSAALPTELPGRKHFATRPLTDTSRPSSPSPAPQ